MMEQTSTNSSLCSIQTTNVWSQSISALLRFETLQPCRSSSILIISGMVHLMLTSSALDSSKSSLRVCADWTSVTTPCRTWHTIVRTSSLSWSPLNQSFPIITRVEQRSPSSSPVVLLPSNLTIHSVSNLSSKSSSTTRLSLNWLTCMAKRTRQPRRPTLMKLSASVSSASL